jgi:transmembrane sensor
MTEFSSEKLQAEALSFLRQRQASPDDTELRSQIQAWVDLSSQHQLIWQEEEYLWLAMGKVENKQFTGWESLWLQCERASMACKDAARPPIIAAVLILILAYPALELWMPDISGGTTVATLDQTGDFTTQWQEQRDVILEDGSVVTLNWDSHISVDFSGTHRLVELKKGEALFSVKPDKSRPFVVEVGGITATAVGTEYSVRRYNHEHADILVTSGLVKVGHDQDIQSGMLQAGDKITANKGLLEEIKHIPMNEIAAWKKGVLIFNDKPLVEVLGEIDRYTTYSIDASQLQNGDEAVTGVYFLDQIDDAYKSLVQAFNLETEMIENNQVVVRTSFP